jgi:hypothetical protein
MGDDVPDEIDKYFKMKPCSDPDRKYEPDSYLGVKFKKKVQLGK